MSLRVFNPISTNDEEKIKDLSEPQKYLKPFLIAYIGNIPNVAFVLHSGKVRIYNKKQERIVSEPGVFLLRHLLESKGSPFNVEILAESIVSPLDKTLIKQLGLSAS
ncbi:MAG: hypothetical protein KDD50_07275 [Bdellovibrionales bacterium]|nr:hypothetical protein [Bdellovibrionales bacterium]